MPYLSDELVTRYPNMVNPVDLEPKCKITGKDCAATASDFQTTDLVVDVNQFLIRFTNRAHPQIPLYEGCSDCPVPASPPRCRLCNNFLC